MYCKSINYNFINYRLSVFFKCNIFVTLINCMEKDMVGAGVIDAILL